MGKRYYWLKLKTDFFDQKEIKLLRRIAGGDTYTIIYLKMLLKSVQNDGKLFFDGIANNFTEEIALDIDEDEENVKLTLAFLQSKGLIEYIADNELELAELNGMIGSENASTQRVREYRKRQKALHCNADVTDVKRLGNVEIDIEKEIEKDIEKDIEIEKEKTLRCTNVHQTHSKCTPEYRDKSIENRDKSIKKENKTAQDVYKMDTQDRLELEKEIEKEKKNKTKKHKYGDYQNVLLTDEDLEKLKNEFPNDWENRIERLGDYIASTGKVYKNHLATIRNWAKRDKEKPVQAKYQRTVKVEKVPDWVKANDEQWEKTKQKRLEELESERLKSFGGGETIDLDEIFRSAT